MNKLDPDSESPATERLGRIYIHHVRRLKPNEQDGDDAGDSVGYGTSSKMAIAIIEKNIKMSHFFRNRSAFSLKNLVVIKHGLINYTDTKQNVVIYKY